MEYRDINSGRNLSVLICMNKILKNVLTNTEEVITINSLHFRSKIKVVRKKEQVSSG